MKGDDLEQWHACQSKVQDLGFSSEEAEKFLNKAFAWQQGYWGPEKPKPEEPAKSDEPAKVETLATNMAGESILEAKVEQKDDKIEPVEVNDEVKS